MSPESPSVITHTLLRAYCEGEEATQQANYPLVQRMCEFLEERRVELAQVWTGDLAVLLPGRRNAAGTAPEWWFPLADKFLELLLRHLLDTDDLACHRFVKLVTRAAYRAGYTAAELVCTQVALKRLLVKTVVGAFGDQPHAVRVMCTRLESEIDHIRLHVAECYYAHNQRELLKAERRRWALFAHAGDAIVLVDPNTATLLDANEEAMALFGLDKRTLRSVDYLELFTPGSRNAMEERLIHRPPVGASFLDHVTVTTTEGVRIPVTVRSTVIDYGGARVIQSVVHDESDARDLLTADERASRELEGIVAARTRELHLAQQKFRRLYSQERRQVERLGILREIAETALDTRNTADLLAQAVVIVREHFRHLDVSVFSVGQAGDWVLRAHAGSAEHALREGYRTPSLPGLLGEAARLQLPLLTNDAAKDSRYAPTFPAADRTRSQLVVPVLVGDRCTAVLEVASRHVNAFDDGDLTTMEAVARQLALGMQKVALHEETRRAHEFSNEIIQGMPSSLIAVDADNYVKAANGRFRDESGAEGRDCVGKPLVEVVEDALLGQVPLLDMIAEARATGDTVTRHAVHHTSPRHPDRFLDVRVKPLGSGPRADVLLVIDNVTESSRRIFQMELLYRVTRLIQSSLDEDYVLHATLTCVTAGPALGFNRAFVLLAEDNDSVLQGRVAVGPRDEADASRIYTDLAQHAKDLKELVAQYKGPQPPEPGSLHELVLGCRLPVEGEAPCPIVQVFRDRKPRRFSRDDHLPGPDCCVLGPILDAEEFAAAALEAGDRAIGLILVDNRFTRAPIDDEAVRLLATVARQAGLALANARAHAEVARKAEQLEAAYIQLREAHDDLVRQEKLAAAGEMSARVSHEIRNPLVTIGGFARRILKTKDVPERVAESARIMVEEVDKLETFLTNWLDLARPGDSMHSPEDLNTVVEHALLMANTQSLPEGVTVVKEFAPSLPPVMMDARRLQQAVVNLTLNAIQALNGSGQVRVRTRLERNVVCIDISDDGVGIPENVLDHIFQPFFTTKLSGSGLGLAVTQRIVEDHEGRLAVQSKEGEGTTMTIVLPLAGPRKGDDHAETGAEQSAPEAASPGLS